ncbi:MAG: ChbG/HpnK family deacetylase, partial [Paenibacillus sp.]|nr:ChbG/HpnK family deacetylase [Paenibacillus sp.]
HMKEGETYDKFKKSMIENIYVLPEGVSETYIHPATDDFRLGKLIPSWRKRVWEYKLMLDPDFDYALRDAKVKLTDYRFVRDYSKRPRVRSVGKFVKLMLTKRQASNDW